MNTPTERRTDLINEKANSVDNNFYTYCSRVNITDKVIMSKTMRLIWKRLIWSDDIPISVFLNLFWLLCLYVILHEFKQNVVMVVMVLRTARVHQLPTHRYYDDPFKINSLQCNEIVWEEVVRIC